MRLHPGTLEALRMIRSDPKFAGVQIACASTSETPHQSLACLNALEIWKGTTFSDLCVSQQIGKKGGHAKFQHFANIKEETGID